MVDWNEVGDGSIFDGMPEQGQSPDVDLRKDQAATRAAYGQSIQYSLNTLVSFVQTYGDKNLVLVVLGDHQPASTVSAARAPATTCRSSIIAHDPAVMDRISGWGWQDGLRPGPEGAGLADGRVPRPVPHRLQRIAASTGRSTTARKRLPSSAARGARHCALESRGPPTAEDGCQRDYRQ